MTGICEVCGNTYDKAFQIIRNGETFIFDSFECAVTRLAPTCAHCGCRVIGHGLEAHNRIYCCVHCAKQHGETTFRDRAAS